MNRPKPYVIMEDPRDTMGVWTQVAEFDTAEQASLFIFTNLPKRKVDAGDYSIDGPAEDWDDDYMGWVLDGGKIKWHGDEPSTIDRDLKDEVVGRLYELRAMVDNNYDHYSVEGLRAEIEEIEILIHKVESL